MLQQPRRALARFVLSIPQPTPAWSELKCRFGWEWNGMRLHEVYFGNLTKKRTNLEKTAGLGAGSTNRAHATVRA